jgi:TolB-like protein/Tfp pilus assembly protein PilF
MAEEQTPKTATTPGRDVFISYASQDAGVANAIVADLEQRGIRCWIAPRDVRAGAQYADAIVRAITDAKALVLVLSASAIASSHVGKEIERASSKKRPIIALRTDSAPLTPALEYFLSESQWIEVQHGKAEAAYAKLVAAIRDPEQTAPAATSVAAMSAMPPKPRRTSILLATGLALIAIALTVLFVSKFWHSTPTPATPPASPSTPEAAIPDKSIAVLPFADMSEKHDQEYMSDGIAEELLNLLAQAPGLKVIARTSSFSFKGKEVDIAEIARRLRVATVLEGSVRKSGDKIRITAQLIRTADSTHLWSETYDRPLKDVFAVQDEIAGAIVQALQIRLAGGELSRQKGGTQNLEAYQLYLRAQSANRQNSRASLDAAAAYLEQATKIDPGYGLAWAALSEVFSNKADNGFLDATKGYEMAREAANRAFQLSPGSAYVNSRLAYIDLNFDWDWAAAEAAGRRARAINSTDPDVLNQAGILAYALGNWSDAERQLQESLIRDPLNSYVLWNLGYTYYAAGRFSESEAVYRNLLEIEPNFAWTFNSLGKVLLQEGKADEALAAAQLCRDEGERLKYIAVFLQAVGRQAEADKSLQAQITRWADTGAYYIAMTYAYRGNHELAMEWLERAYKQKDAFLSTIKGEHLFKGLADDPSFKAFLRKMNLPE